MSKDDHWEAIGETQVIHEIKAGNRLSQGEAERVVKTSLRTETPTHKYRWVHGGIWEKRAK